MNSTSSSFNPMDKSDSGGCQANNTCQTALYQVQILVDGRLLCWVCLSRARLGPLVPVNGTLYALAYKDFLDNSMLPTLWELSGVGLPLIQQQCTKQGP